MSFYSRLEIDGKEIVILNCSIDIAQDSDVTGRPSARPIAGQFTIRLQVDRQTDDMLAQWALSPNEHKRGKITFIKSNSMSVEQNIEFNEAYCLRYNKNFDAEDETPMSVSLHISAKGIKIGANDEHVNNWPSA
ncbi:type VI secretion system tube protein TssD [Aquimarina hainanensis]|uniref:Type VI secretion system tube protein TssD n=1 Tax=Aquimarina hainanensis TaxID=1578017 RepID=A0ABW5N9J1_9FLAO|nr:type VI secretion system tube protein TssD [Aquimarina sp. TRL1]QKX05734.1 phage tail protein [Aquimarina sp. TRL1]